MQEPRGFCLGYFSLCQSLKNLFRQSDGAIREIIFLCLSGITGLLLVSLLHIFYFFLFVCFRAGRDKSSPWFTVLMEVEERHYIITTIVKNLACPECTNQNRSSILFTVSFSLDYRRLIDRWQESSSPSFKLFFLLSPHKPWKLTHVSLGKDEERRLQGIFILKQLLSRPENLGI